MFCLGETYLVYTCDSASEEFRIVEDYWAVSWFSFGYERLFRLIDSKTDNVTATISLLKISNHSSIIQRIFAKAAWTAHAVDSSGNAMASIHQQSPWEAGWQFPFWYVE